MYMISTARVTLPCSSSIPAGNSFYVFIITLDGFILVILSFRDPKFGPKMSSVSIMSAFVIGQFDSILFSIYLI